MPVGPALASVLQSTTIDSIRAARDHDAIVIGGGAAGGFAAMLLCEHGLRVLVLDAGIPSGPLQAPLRCLTGCLAKGLSAAQGMRWVPPKIIAKSCGALRLLGRWRQPIQSRCYAWMRAPEAFVDDRDCPYVTAPDHPFVWIRSRMLGGRVAVPGHGRQYYRFAPDDFRPRDGQSPRWPLQVGELDKWYDLVERRLGLSGMNDGHPWLPDSVLSRILVPTQTEEVIRKKIIGRWPNVRPILSRHAPPLQSLEIAARTGRLRCRQGAVAKAIRVDDAGKVCGVAWIDHASGREHVSYAPLVFLCASALESTRLLMLSPAPKCPGGLGGKSGVLGRYLMDHVVVGAESAPVRTFAEAETEGGRCIHLPRFDARGSTVPLPSRGFSVQLYPCATTGDRSYLIAVTFAEMLPRHENRISLDRSIKDAWGIPVLRIECSHGEVELARAREQKLAIRELFDLAGAKLARIDDAPVPPGSAVHECGTARMGTDPVNSVLDPNNQCWDARGLYVTDGACFPSQGTQNPTLTILALTARACAHALASMHGKDSALISALT
jgi:choline dehydrogenase-like flavoprotein